MQPYAFRSLSFSNVFELGKATIALAVFEECTLDEMARFLVLWVHLSDTGTVGGIFIVETPYFKGIHHSDEGF